MKLVPDEPPRPRLIETPKEARKRWKQKIVSPGKNARVEAILQRKRDTECQDDCYLLLKHAGEDANDFESMENLRLPDSVALDRKKRFERLAKNKGPGGMNNFRQSEIDIKEGMKMGYPVEKIDDHISAIKYRKGL